MNNINLKYRKAFVCLSFFWAVTSQLMAQNIEVKGIVEDTHGNLIENAIVTVADQTVLTTKMGTFAIKASKADLVTVTKEGFKTQQIHARSKVFVKLVAKLAEKQVETIYGQQAFRSVTSSISTINNEQFSKTSVLAFGNALYGKLPGLNLKQADGEPGDDYPDMLIRGQHTFTGKNAPLVLVDGFERGMNTLSVDEVESVSVLKDAASTALYGMDGANGVILVKTKRGQAGKKEVGFKVELGSQSPTRIPRSYGSYDYARMYNQAQMNDGKTTLLYSEAQLQGYKDNIDPIRFPNVDWVAETIRDKAPVRKYLMDFRGGNEVARYYVNVGLDDAEGIYKNSDREVKGEAGIRKYSTNRDLQRINFRSNIDVNVSKHFYVRLDLAGRLENVNSPTESSYNIFNNIYSYHPNVSPVLNADGTYGGTNTYKNNPLAFIVDKGYMVTHRRYFQSNINAVYDLSTWVQGLKIGVKAALDNYYTVGSGYSKTYAVVDSAGVVYGTNSNLSKVDQVGQAEQRSTNFEAFTQYSKTINKHKIDALLLFHQNEYIANTEFPNRRLTYSGSFSYGYNQKYFVNFAAQYGATENFMKGKRYGFFPALSAAWVASDEQFFKNVKGIDFLKLRASTGLVGNQEVGGTRFGYNTLYYTSGLEYPLGNPDLTWEKSYKTDVAIDLTLLKNIDLSICYFNEFRDDILNSGTPLTPSYFGNSFGYFNYGQVSSQGLELSLQARKQYVDWGYRVGLNATLVDSKVVRMQEITRQWDYLYAQGHPVNQRFGLIAEGLFQSQEEIDAAPVQTFGKVIPGSIRYKDLNNDHVINSDDFTAIGKSATVPTWDLGFNLGFNFKNIYVDANFQAAIGREVNMRSDSEGAMYSVAPLYGDRTVSTYVKNPWTPETASIADYPSLTIENAANNFVTSSYWLRNGDFLRLRSLEIGYDLPKKAANWMFLSSLNIYVRGMNLFTLDHIKYFDPEVMEGYPVTKSVHVGLNVKF